MMTDSEKKFSLHEYLDRLNASRGAADSRSTGYCTTKLLLGVDLSSRSFRGMILDSTHILSWFNPWQYQNEMSVFVKADMENVLANGLRIDSAVFDQAILRRAILNSPLIANSSFKRVTLEGASIHNGILWNVDLTEADLSGATLGNTILSDLDLSTVKGLETVRHEGPSSVDVATLRRSRGKIPEEFLRGCGLAPWEVLQARLYDPALTVSEISEIQYKIFQLRAHGPLFLGGVFISYSHADSKFVDKIYNQLREAGASVWLDRHDLDAGSLQKQISRAIRLNDVVLLVLSETSVQSDWVENELDMARRKERDEGRDVLCPVALDDSWKSRTFGNDSEERVLWRTLTRKNILDFSKWKTKAFNGQFDKLLRGLKVNYPKRNGT